MLSVALLFKHLSPEIIVSSKLNNSFKKTWLFIALLLCIADIYHSNIICVIFVISLCSSCSLWQQERVQVNVFGCTPTSFWVTLVENGRRGGISPHQQCTIWIPYWAYVQALLLALCWCLFINTGHSSLSRKRPSPTTHLGENSSSPTLLCSNASQY